MWHHTHHRTQRRPSLIALAAAACLLTLHASLAHAWPSGGGGSGTGSNGGGLIYFYYQIDMYTMLDDGSGLTRFTGYDTHYYGPYVEPSRVKHAGRRWFVQPGFSPDYLLLLSDSGATLSLPLPDGVEIIGRPRWGIDDELLSFEGVLWDVDPDSPRFGDPLEGGLYTVWLAADEGGNLTGAAGTAELAFEAPLVVDANDGNRIRPDMRDHDWSPDGVQFAFGLVSSKQLRIGDVTTELDGLLIDASAEVSVATPRWSPAGNRIMLYLRRWGSYPEVALINPDGSNLKTLVRGSPNGSYAVGVWSPSGSHLLVRYFDNFLKDHHLLRMTASGSGKTRITAKNAWPAAGFGPVPTGWRD